MYESSRLQPAVKRMLAAAQPRETDKAALRPLGIEEIDRALGGGLVAGKLHEVFADDRPGEASALGFAAMLALCVTQAEKTSRTILWLREEAAQRKMPLHGPGLADLGLDPGRLVLGILPDAKALLRAAADALRCAALGTVIIELGGNPALLDLTASRRLALAAEETGVTPLVLRLRGARPTPSAAQTRWQVAPVLSAVLEADAPGYPALRLSLLRQRGGMAGLDWEVEWDRDAVCFRPAALPGARLPLSGGGPDPLDQTAERAGDTGWRIAS
jgi:protein ImuA